MAELNYILNPVKLQNLAKEWLLEDTSNFDIAGGIVGKQLSCFQILYKEKGIVAGIPFAEAICSQLKVKLAWFVNEGDFNAQPGKKIGTLTGHANHLLLAERIVLNVMSRASGIATAAHEILQILKDLEWKGVLAGTRKTTPGFRFVEKYAMMVGGADTHRYDLSSLVMIKDNVIDLNESITTSIKKAKELKSFTQKIEVECRTMKDAIEAGVYGCDIIMLDNFDPEKLFETARHIKETFPNILIEASGGITKENVKNYASPDVDIISTSALTQGYKTMDISMAFNK